MTKHNGKRSQVNQPIVYQIRLEGHLDCQWTDWFSGLTITLEQNGDTLLTGPIIDQAALFGLLKKVRDLGLPLISLNRIEPYPEHSRGAGKPDMSSTPLEKEK
jgi:hypothetical protein